MNLFRLDGSVRTEGSISRAVADTVEAGWRTEHPDARITRRDVGLEPLSAGAWAAAVRVAFGQSSSAGHDAVALAGRLADELLEADGYLFASPLYNFGVPQHVKTWLDLVILDPRVGPQGDRPLAGRPAVLVMSRGGGYGPGTPREGWDHATPYLRRIFADSWGLDLKVVEAELTLAPVTPAMSELIGLHEESLRNAHATAEEHAKHLAGLVAA
ncbi:FMN-dependent NADH-azoreductase [Virgisporangium aliadipatigenens]|uniref:FMN dependent NADH:quinone oxidoreductase n=1 Tax=Virgisporangium aliadipatigenens TaxID=741659 RepID=A0A8J3YK00_9ACTN|nr:NAD(P)H-dependent oxidoreductase [Virgisporangium aliadipatigenens]GIJ45513.1 FMN-dependent NADH-azoreductase [Virgisporangium aliadipatigenens]